MLNRSINLEVIYFEQPFEERFAAAKRDGFTSIEFWGWEDKNLDQVKNLLETNGLKITGMGGDGPYSMCEPAEKKEYIAYVERAIEAAKKVGCPSLIIHSDALQASPQYAKPLQKDYSFTTKICTMFDTLKTIAPMAEKAGITFVLESLNAVKDHCGNFLKDTGTAGDLVRAVGSPNVKILYDAYHMYLEEGKICETLKANMDVIGYIHIADAPGRNEPGTGAINYRNVLDCLAGLGYDGAVGFELYPANGTAKAITAIKEASDNL